MTELPLNVNEFNAKILKENDVELDDKYFPKSGGALSGNVIKREVTDSSLTLYGGIDSGTGAQLSLHGDNITEIDSTIGYAGGFILSTSKGTSGSYRYLQGSPNGRLTWGKGGINTTVATDLAGSAIVAKSLGQNNGYVKYASGLIMQWGHIPFSTEVTFVDVIFPISYTGRGYYACNANLCGDSGSYPYNAKSIVLQYTNDLAGNGVRINFGSRCEYGGQLKWFAIGY